MLITSLTIKPAENGYLPLELVTNRGPVGCRHFAAPGATAGVLWAGGACGGWSGPGGDLYETLCRELQHEGISSLHLRFRQPGSLEESVLDALTGLSFLRA